MRKIFVAAIFILLPFLVFAQDNTKKKAYFFYLETCPHCRNVENYFDTNGIWDKYDITKMDAANPFNANLLNKFDEVFKDPNPGGVPAIAFADKFITGDQPIINNFQKEIDASDQATDLPDPNKIVAASPKTDVSTQPTQVASTASENKKNYLPVIIGALVVIGIGALIYINKK